METQTSKLEVDIVKKMDYDDNIDLWKACATRMTVRERATAGEQM